MSWEPSEAEELEADRRYEDHQERVAEDREDRFREWAEAHGMDPDDEDVAPTTSTGDGMPGATVPGMTEINPETPAGDD